MADPTPTEPESLPRPGAVPHRFTLQDELFIFCSLMLFTCCFLPWQAPDFTPWGVLSSFESSTISTGWILYILLVGLTLWSVSRPRFRPWLAILTALSVNTAIAGFNQSAYGAELARFFALGLLVLSANPVIVSVGDLAMRRLNSKQAEVFTHWGTVLPGIYFSAQDFYTKLETMIAAREWPGVTHLRVRHSEAGLLSHRREYLRVIRQRQVFDICAASFGKDYFFTLREAEVQAQLSIATVIIFLLALAMLFSLAVSRVGLIAAAIYCGVLFVFGTILLMNVLRMGLTKLDGVLLRTPVIGPIYETWFRRSTTYFQHDTRMVFLKLMDDLVKEQVSEETSEKGVKLLSCFEHQPILDGIYKSTTISAKEKKYHGAH